MPRIYVSGLVLCVLAFALIASANPTPVEICNTPPGEYRTQTQGGWHTNCNGGNPGCYRDQYFSQVFTSGLTVGGEHQMLFTSSSAVKNFLPEGGTAGTLVADLVNPTTSPSGVLGGQITALALNIGFGEYGVPTFDNIGGLYYQVTPFAGWTVQQIFELANTVLGGNTAALPEGVSVSGLSDVLASINENFDNGVLSNGYICTVPPCPTPPPQLITVGQNFCLQFCGNPITVYWCCPLEGMPVFSWAPGCLSDNPYGCNIDCSPYEGQLHWTARWDSSNTECPAPGGWWSAEFTADGWGCVCVTFDRQLAVELLDFTASAENESVTLRWSTASESNNDYFEIARDGAVISYLNGIGSSTSRTDYVWVDRSELQSGETYTYTLSAVDVNGARHRLGSRQVVWNANTGGVIDEFALQQNYPNPFNPSTMISYSLAEPSLVSLSVFDLTGREVAELVRGEQAAGAYSVSFNAGNLPAGMYFYRLQAGSFNAVRKLILMK